MFNREKENHLESVYLAYLDFLGFSNYFMNKFNSFESDPLYKSKSSEYKLRGKIKAAKYHYDNLIGGTITGPIVNFKLKTEYTKGRIVYKPDFKESIINSLVFSDSVCIWTNNDSFEEFNKLVIIISDIIKNSLIQHYLPIRGAISNGFVIVSNKHYESPNFNLFSTFYGDAIIKAVKLENKQMWAGCLIENDCIKYLENKDNRLSLLIDNKAIINYNVPIKEKEDQKYFVINWIGNDDDLEINEFDDRIRKWFKNSKNEDVKKKMHETQKFAKNVIRSLKEC